jgi:regulator of sigma D
MSLFTNSIVDDFKSIPAVRDKFSNYQLLNSKAFKEFLNETLDDIVHGDIEAGSKVKSKAAKKRLQKLEDHPEKVAADMMELKTRMCNTVGGQYVRTSIKRALATDFPGYDAIVIIKPSLRSSSRSPQDESDVEMLERLRKDKMAKIVGFLIAQRGECPKYPNAYAVNLICARERGISSMLMGCYLYCIKRHPRYMQKGLLELANEYNNLNGFCAYRKMGYVFDPDIYSANCLKFADAGDALLPMSVDIDAMTIEDIIARTTQSTPIPDVVCDRRFSTNLGDEENREEKMFRLTIKNLHRLYYLISMFFIRKDNLVSFFLFHASKPYTKLLKSLLMIDYAPMNGGVAYAKLKLCFLQIIGWVEGGGSFVSIPPQDINVALTELYGLFPPGMLSANPLLHLIEFKIHSLFDSYIAYQASVRNGTYASPPHSPVASVAPPAPPGQSAEKNAQMLIAKTIAKLKAKRRPNSPERSAAEIRRDAIKLLISVKKAKAHGPHTPTSPSSASRKKGKGTPSTARSSAKHAKKKSQSKTAKKMASASSKKKLKKADSASSNEELGMYYTLGSTLYGELNNTRNIAKINKVMEELGITTKLTNEQYIEEVVSQCTRKIYTNVMQRFITIYVMNNRTNKLISGTSIGPNTNSGLDFHDWITIARICDGDMVDHEERAIIRSICESLNNEFASSDAASDAKIDAALSLNV